MAKNGQVTRVVLDTSSIPSYKIFTLNNPRRVVIDLADAKLATKVNQAVFDSSYVDKLRYAHRKNNKLRIVLDLNEKIIPKSFVLPASGNSHHRLVIDLKNSAAGTSQIAKGSKKNTKIASKTQNTNTTSKKAVSKTKVTQVKKINKAKVEEDIIAKITSAQT